MTWVVPDSLISPFAQARGCSKKECILPPEAGLYVTSSGKPRQRPPSWHGWKRRAYALRLFGAAISKPSMADAFAEWWMASVQASRASPGASQALNKDMKTRGGSGPASHTSFARWVPGLCDWRTYPDLFEAEGLPVSSATWPASGSMRNGALYPHKTLEPINSARGSSSWPTATTADAHGHGYQIDSVDRTKQWPTLAGASRDWPSPRAGDAKMGTETAESRHRRGAGGPTLSDMAAGTWATPTSSNPNEDESIESFEARQALMKERHGNGNGMGIPLGLQARLWPTPATRDHHAQGATHNPDAHSSSLATVVEKLWPTPVAHDAKGGKTPAQVEVMRELTGAGVSNLNETVETWATPSARDFKDTPGMKMEGTNPDGSVRDRTDQLARQAMLFSPTDPMTGAGSQNSPSAPTSRRRLNPAFVCWLMGWPWWWTRTAPISCAEAEMDAYRFKLRLLLSYLTGGLTNE